MDTTVFKGFDIRGDAAAGLTTATAWDIGKALADWLPTSGSVAIACGLDGSKLLTDALIEGLRLQGRDVVHIGTCGKIALTEAIIHEGHSGGVLINHDTLSQEETIELYRDAGKLIDRETGLAEIQVLVESGNFVPAAIKGDYTAIA